MSYALRRLHPAALVTLGMSAYGATLPANATEVTATSTQQAAVTNELMEEVFITGSRILRPNLDSTVPIVSVGAEEIFQTGNTSVGDLLNNLPSLRSTYGQSNSSRTLGTAGLNLLDLRGLGTQRTLVLVNGRRHVGADILYNTVSPDINTFPSDLIERIDVVTGGGSAVYGSDAIAGIVNYVLKRDYEGLQLRSQYGQSTYHDAGNYFLSGVGGKNFADGKGNIAVNVEYAAQKPFFASGRSNLASVNSFVVVDTDPAGSPSGSDGVPDRLFYDDVRLATSSIGGSLSLTPAVAANAPCGRDAAGAAFTCRYMFQPDGSVVPQTGTRVGIAPNGNFIGGNGTSGREGQTLGIFPKLDRASFNLVGHYTVSDAFEPFIEAKYVRTDSIRFGAPAFFSGSTIGFGVDLRERPLFSNPFLSDASRIAINVARATIGLTPLTATSRLTLAKTLTDLGGRQENAKRETFRVVLGATGELSDDWRYEASVNYGEFKEATKVRNNLNQQRFLLAMDSTRDSAGNIVCRSQIDSTAATIFPFSEDDLYATSTLAGDVLGCVPLNPFGAGNITPAMRNYLIQDTTSIGRIRQFDISAFITGNSSRWFSLPAGPIGIAAGVESRTEDSYWKADELVAKGLTFYNALPLFDPPRFGVKEVFSELRVPLLKDVPGFRALTLSAAGRLASYKGETGKVLAYNGNIDWAPINALRFRAGVARSVRAPNLLDLYEAQGANFAQNFVDPCSARNIGTGSATRAANCAAAGIPTNYDYVYSSSLEVISGGNPELQEESSDSVTIGAVFQPAFLPDFSLSIDYFKIDVDDVITSPTGQQIANACYDASSLNNQFCTLFRRAGAGGAPTGEEAYRIIEGSLEQTKLNYAKRTAAGVDTEIAYQHPLSGWGTLDARLIYTYSFDRDNFLDPANPARANQVLQEVGDPQLAYNFDLDLIGDQVSLGWQLRYLGKMALDTAENIYSVNGRAPENVDYADRQFYPAVLYHNMRAGYDVAQNASIYVGIDNVFNQPPPLGLTATGEGNGIYDIRGRFFYAGVKIKLF